MYTSYEHHQPSDQEVTEHTLPLNTKLQHVLDSIGDLVKTTNIVAINANISAAKMSTEEGRVFEQIAKEMREISQSSLQEIQGLGEILKEVRDLSVMINLAGRQRMLAQKTMKLVCLQRVNENSDNKSEKELSDTIHLFEESHKKLAGSSLNTQAISSSLTEVWTCWCTFKNSLEDENLDLTNQINNKLITLINAVVTHYQSLAG